jgi:nucleotide-binding universal stress UspA family protein
MKTILLPTDFSENALNAIKYTVAMYRDEVCEFLLLYAYEVNGYVEGSTFEASPIASKLEEAKQKFEGQLNDLKNSLAASNVKWNHKFSIAAKNQSIIDAIQEEIKIRDIELVAIGTQGATGRYELDFGSNTIAIIENIKNCPVLAIPRNERFTGLNEIVLANGYKLKNEANDFNFLIHLSKKFNAPVRVLNISETGGLSPVQEENQLIVKQLLSETEHSFHMLEHVTVPEGIYCFSESRNSDMIAFVNKKYTFIQKLFFKPLYKNLGNYAKIPVLVLHRTLTINNLL